MRATIMMMRRRKALLHREIRHFHLPPNPTYPYPSFPHFYLTLPPPQHQWLRPFLHHLIPLPPRHHQPPVVVKGSAKATGRLWIHASVRSSIGCRKYGRRERGIGRERGRGKAKRGTYTPLFVITLCHFLQNLPQEQSAILMRDIKQLMRQYEPF